jgi:hypothetical protein
VNGKANNGHKVALSTSDLEPNTPSKQMEAIRLKSLATPVRIHFLSRRIRLTDSDGASAKAVIDGLVRAGFFPDDSPKEISEVSYSQEKIKKGEEEETLIYIYQEVS